MHLDSRTFRSKVARRAFLLFVACALIPVSVLALISLRQVSSELRGQSERRQRQASKAIGLLLHKRLLTLEAEIEPSTREMQREISDELEAPFLNVILVGSDGQSRTLLGDAKSVPPLSPEQEHIVRAGGTLLTVDADDPRPTRFFLSRPRDRKHPENGILRGEINPSFIWEIEDEATLEAGTNLVVLDDSGRPLFASSGSSPATAALRAHARLGPAGQFTWNDADHEYLASYWSLFLKNNFHSGNWIVVLSRDTEDIFSPVAEFRRNFTLIAALSLLVVVLVSLKQIRRILLPLDRLQEATQRLALGRLDTRVDVKSHDEFEELGGSFNQMAAQLGRQFDALALRSELTLALSRDVPPEAMLQACTEILVRHLNLSLAGVWLIGGEATVLVRAAIAGPAQVPAGALDRIRMGENQIGSVAADGRPITVTMSPDDSRWLDAAWTARERIEAFVGHPLIIDGKVKGVVAVFSSRPLDVIDLGSVASAAADVAQAIARRRVSEALRGSEEQVRQLQKMEAVGRLAGGVAHDFNNLLTVILSYCQFLNAEIEPQSRLRQSTEVIEKTALRAAQLTQQLLAFSRKQVLAPKVIDLNTVIGSLTPILSRLVGEKIEFVFTPSAEPALVKVDPGQIEQVIVNVVVNARDAMPRGGKLKVETSSAVLSASDAEQHPGLRAGPHTVLRVTDTGVGMDAATRARIFEPFFTTKAPGKGTGLGLATVYGIVAQSGGCIDVESEVGKGTSFTFHFPRAAGAIELAQTADLPTPKGTETLLVVEDEYEVRTLLQRALTDYGYQVLSAGRPSDALRMAEEHVGRIHCLITDRVMPEMSGDLLVERLRTSRPDLVVLQMSGYTEYRSDDAEPVAAPLAFIQKPFTPDTLAREIRRLLDARTATGPVN